MGKIREKIRKLSKKILQKLKNNVFGDSQEGKFKVGEIVRWQAWHIKPEAVVRKSKYGVLLGISDGIVDRRTIKIAEILPFGESTPIKISLILVKKSDLGD